MEPFERLNRKLNALASMESIGADDIFETISLLLSDVDALSGKKGVNAYGIKHEDLFATSLLKTLNAAMLSYESNTDSLAGISERQKRNYQTALEKLTGVQSVLTALMPTLEDLEATNKALENEASRLEAVRVRSAELDRSIGELTELITKLKSISLEDLEEKEKTLRDACQTRQAQISDLESKVAAANTQNKELTATMIVKEAELEKASAEKEDLEKKIGEATRWLTEYQEWKEAFGREHEATLKKLHELHAQMEAVGNAWRVMSQRPDLPEIFSAAGGLRAFNRQITSLAELEEWFRDMDNGLEKSLSAYAETYNALLTAVETETNG